MANRKLKLEMVSADWKNFSGFFENLQQCLGSLKIPYLVPSWRENGDSLSIIIGNAPFTEGQARDVFGPNTEDETKFQKLARLHRDLANEYEITSAPYSHMIAAILDEIAEAEKED